MQSPSNSKSQTENVLVKVPDEFDETSILEELISVSKSTTINKKSSGFRGRGIDFKARFLSGQWSEEKLVEAINKSNDLVCVHYGASEIGPEEKIEEYFKAVEKTETHGKRPDLLVYNKSVFNKLVKNPELKRIFDDFTHVPDAEADQLAKQAIFAIECENSLWKVEKMPRFGKPSKRKKNQPLGLIKFPKNAVIPRIWIKKQDIGPLCLWYRDFNYMPLYVVQIFFDHAYSCDLRRFLYYLSNEFVTEEIQEYSGGGSKGQKKVVYKIPYAMSYLTGKIITEPSVVPALGEEKNGKIVPYAYFEGGEMMLSTEITELWMQHTDR